MSRQRDNYENSFWAKLKRWLDGEVDPLSYGMESLPSRKENSQNYIAGVSESTEDADENQNMDLVLERKGIRIYRQIYQIMSVILCLSISFVLLWTNAYLPAIGNAGNPDNNEVSAR